MRTRTPCPKNKPASKKAASVGDTLKLPSGATASVTKLLKKNGFTTHIYFKQSGMSQECISVNDAYDVIPAAIGAKLGKKTQSSPKCSRLVGIRSKGKEKSEIGEKGRKFFDQCGWLEGHVESADVAKDNSTEVLYLVKFSDGSTQQLDEKELTEFKYELTNINDTPPPVRHFVTSSPNEDAATKNSEEEPKSDGNDTIPGGNLDTPDRQSPADMDSGIVSDTNNGALHPSSTDPLLPKATISTEVDRSFVALANIHNMLAATLQPTNSIIRSKDDFKDISAAPLNQTKDIKCRVISTGNQQRVPFHWPKGSRSILVEKSSFDIPNEKFQIVLKRTKPLRLICYQGVLYCKNRRGVNPETPCCLSGQVYHLVGSALPFVIAFGVEFEKVSGPAPTEIQGPMMFLGFVLGDGGNFDQLYLVNSLALVKNSLIGDNALKEILNASEETIVAALQKGIQAAVSWLEKPLFNSVMWRKMSSSIPFPGVSMIPDDSITVLENPKMEKKPKPKRKSQSPSEDSSEKRTKSLATARAQNKELKQKNQELRLQADLMYFQETKKNEVSSSNTGGDITVSLQDLLTAVHAKDLAEKKLEWALEQQETIKVSEKLQSDAKVELLERMITMKDGYQESESKNHEKQMRLCQTMSNQNAANMLKVQIASLGSKEGNSIIGMALQNNFFSNNSPDRRSHQGLSDDHHLIGNDHEPPRRLLLGGPQAHAPLDKKRIRDEKTVRIQALIETLGSLDDELKCRAEGEISRLNGEVSTLNKEIAIALCSA